jgi:PAS domain S-box-containing protein
LSEKGEKGQQHNQAQTRQVQLKKPSMRIRVYSLMILFVMAAILTVVGIVTFDHLQKVVDARLSVTHSHDVLSQIERVENITKSAEAGNRGYLLTGRQSYLEPFVRADKRIHPELSKLSTLTKNHESQQERVAQLIPVVRSKFDDMRRSAKVRERSGMGAAVDSILTDKGKQEMDQIEQILSQIKDEESRSLKIRSEAFSEAIADFRRRLIVLAVVSLGSFLAAAAWLNHFLLRRERSETLLQIESAATQAVNKDSSLENTVMAVLEALCVDLDWSFAALWIVDGRSNQLDCALAWHEPEHNCDAFLNVTQHTQFQAGEELPGQAFALNKPVWVKDMAKHATFRRASAASQSGLHTGLAFPVSAGEKVIGVFELFSHKAEQYDEDLLHSVELVGSQIGQFIQRKQVEEIIHETETRLTAILSSMGEGICQIDNDGNLVYLNTRGEELLGYRADELVGQNMHDVIHRHHPDGKIVSADTCPIRQAVKKAEAYEASNDFFQRKDGSFFPVEYVSTPLNMSNTVTGAVLCFRDITERQEIQRRVNEFYSTVSHELRTPLTSIRGALGLLEGGKGGELSPKALHLIQVGRAEADRLVRLINDILDIKKIEAGKLELNLSEVFIDELIMDTRDAVAAIAAEAGVKIVTEIATTGSIRADQDRITQVLTNLMSNAIKFSPPGSQVLIRTSPGKLAGNIRVSIMDQGPGIKSSEMAKLFGMFQQLDASDRRVKGGTGLGLAITKAIVQQHDGIIGVDSTEGKGSNFWFELPSSHAEMVERVLTSELQAFSYDVLMVEDDDVLSETIKETLDYEGFSIRRVGTINDAQRELSRRLPDAMVLDVQLPDGNGLRLLHRLVAEGQQDLPVIVMTGAEVDISSMNYPLLVDWLPKPFDAQRLINSLYLAVGSRREGPPRVLVIEDDAATREVISQQIASLGAQVIEAASGEEALSLGTTAQADLIVLDVGLPQADGFEVINQLRDSGARTTPLLVYTAKDLSKEEKRKLTLGLTMHMTKGVTTSDDFLDGVKALLSGLLKRA